MQLINIVLVRIVQLIVVLFFTFVLSFYFGGLLLLPLAALVGIVNLLSHGAGMDGILATIIAIPVVIVIGYFLYKVPDLFQALVETGASLSKLGALAYKRFETIVKSLRGKAAEPAMESSKSVNHI